MKNVAIITAIFSMLVFANVTSAEVDKSAISNNVDAIVALIDAGKDAKVLKAGDYQPYAFIMEDSGTMLVHPSLIGENFAKTEKFKPIYTALSAADSKGTWVEYEWKGKVKHTYVKKTKNNLIVGSGY